MKFALLAIALVAGVIAEPESKPWYGYGGLYGGYGGYGYGGYGLGYGHYLGKRSSRFLIPTKGSLVMTKKLPNSMLLYTVITYLENTLQIICLTYWKKMKMLIRGNLEHSLKMG